MEDCAGDNEESEEADLEDEAADDNCVAGLEAAAGVAGEHTGTLKAISILVKASSHIV